MTARRCCEALEQKLADAGLGHLTVRYVPPDAGQAWDPGYYIARKAANSAYGAIGVGTDFPAHCLSRREAMAFVAGLIAAKEEAE